MKTILYWFSGTGNSLAVAKALAQRLGAEAQLLPMTATMARPEAPTAPAIGLVFPVYAFGPPPVVLEFLRKLPAGRDTYLFAVNTNGGMPGRTGAILRRACAKRGLTLAAGWSVKMPGNAISLYGAPPVQEQQRYFDILPRQVDAIAATVSARQRGPFQDSAAPLSWLLGAIWHLGSPHFARSDKNYFATEACIHCGLCRKICPVANIELEAGRPVWLHHCAACQACIQYCPVEAIQYGKKTIGRKRYRHPQVLADELCTQQAGPRPA
jgi:ferredoxin